MKAFFAGIITCWLFSSSAVASGSSPVQSLERQVNQVMAILKATQNETPAHQVRIRHQKLWPVVQEAFDFGEIGRRELGSGWHQLSKTEQTAFANTFAELVSLAYLSDADNEIQNVTFDFIDYHFIDEKKTSARVTTRAYWNLLTVNIDYSMKLRNGNWRIYDVGVAGISLAETWRSQLAAVRQQDSPAQLIERLKKQVAAQKRNWRN